jgi:hypothetical protein
MRASICGLGKLWGHPAFNSMDAMDYLPEVERPGLEANNLHQVTIFRISGAISHSFWLVQQLKASLDCLFVEVIRSRARAWARARARAHTHTEYTQISSSKGVISSSQSQLLTQNTTNTGDEINVVSWIQTRDASNQAVAKLRFRQRGHRHRPVCLYSLGMDNLTRAFTYLLHGAESFLRSWPVFATNQEISRILWTPKVLYRTHKCPPPVPILSQLHPVPTTPSNFLNTHLNITFPSTPGSPQRLLSLRFPHQHPLHPSFLPHILHPYLYTS